MTQQPAGPDNPLRKNHSFNVMLDMNEVNILNELAHTTNLSRGLCIRQAIRALHTMVCLEAPTCANGSRCYVPQMHTKPPEPAA